MQTECVVWLKRDLRGADHAPLHHALKSGKKVLLLWIYDEFMKQSILHSHRHLRFQLECIYDLKRQLSPSISRFKFYYPVYRTIEIRLVP